jgi:hypothetical protein
MGNAVLQPLGHSRDRGPDTLADPARDGTMPPRLGIGRVGKKQRQDAEGGDKAAE